MPKKKVYLQQAKTTSIRFTSRASINIGNSYYTVEASEERIIPDMEGIDLEQEKKMLWDAVNGEVDNQLLDIQKVYGGKKKG